MKAAVPDQRRVTGSAPRPGEQILDLPFQHVIGRQPDRVTHPAAFQRLVDLGPSERSVRPDHDRLSTPAIPINDGQQDLVPPFRTVDVPRPQFRREAIALDGLEVSVVRRLLLRAVDRTFGTVDVEDHPPRASACRGMLNQVRVQASQAVVVLLLGEDVRLESVERRGERDARVPPLPRCQHPKRRVLGEPLRVVRILVSGQTAVNRLPQQVSQRKLRVASGAGIGEVSLDQRAQAKALVKLAGQQQPGVGRDRGPLKLDTKLGVERERIEPDLVSPTG